MVEGTQPNLDPNQFKTPFHTNGNGFAPYFQEESTIIPEATPEHTFEELMDIAERRANSLRFHLIKEGELHGLQFGQEVQIAFDHPQLADHGHHHSRHVELYMKKLLSEFNTTYPGFYDTSDPNTEKILSAMFLFPYKHDIDQLLSGVRNLSRDEDHQLKVKKGHGPAGGMTVMALSDVYAQAAGLTTEEAGEITAMYNVMTTRHDEPEKFSNTFSITNGKAYKEDEKGDHVLLRGLELLAAYEQDELDLFSLAPSQHLEITYLIKQKYGFIGTGEESRLGLPPSLERYQASKLFEFAGSDEAPLDNLDTTSREKIITSAEICKMSDEFDMFAPYLYQHARTLTTQYSKNRPFSIFNPQSEITVDQAFEMASKGHGEAPTDDVRLLWEALHLNGGDSMVSQIPWVKQFYREHAVAGVLLLRDIGEDLMNGRFGIFQDIYQHRMDQLTAKYKKKISTVSNPAVYTRAYDAKIAMIHDEYTSLEIAFWAKMEKQSFLMVGEELFRPEDRANFQSLMTKGLEEVMSYYAVSESELLELQSRVHSFQELPSMDGVMDGNDSLPSTHNMKLVQKSAITNGKLI